MCYKVVEAIDLYWEQTYVAAVVTHNTMNTPILELRGPCQVIMYPRVVWVFRGWGGKGGGELFLNISVSPMQILVVGINCNGRSPKVTKTEAQVDGVFYFWVLLVLLFCFVCYYMCASNVALNACAAVDCE